NGGTSQADFASLNLAFHVGDDAEHVRENRRLLARELGFPLENLVAAQQVHGDQIHIVTREDAGRGALDFDSALPDTDALLTAENRLPLLILVADCAPIILLDAQKQVLAVVHAGWRGALAGIAGKTARKMQSEFGSRAEDILVGIGPCLSIENLEVGPEVAAQVAEIDAEAVISGFARPHLDLRGLIGRDLQRAGVLPSHIETMPFCTKDDARFFSHRGQNGVAGRFGIVAWWDK
ncbi:MAG TPA: peptidoglycan editing factor PgeF, partial [Abditibacterium sp.]